MVQNKRPNIYDNCANFQLMSQISPKYSMHNSAKYHWPPTYTFEVFALSKDVSIFCDNKKKSKESYFTKIK